MKTNLVHRNVFAFTLIPLLLFALISCESEPVLDSVDNFDHLDRWRLSTRCAGARSHC